MAKGENIFKRKDGRWEARYEKGRDPKGKIKYGFCYGKTYREAKEKVGELKSKTVKESCCSESKKRQFFSYYCDDWLKNKQSRVKASTFAKYGYMLEKHIKPFFGEISLTSLNNVLIEDFTEQLINRNKLSNKTVRDILTCLRSIFRYINKQYPGILPSVDVICPREKQKEMRVLSVSEQKKFTEYLMTDMDNCKFGVLLALVTGMRIGEICALKWCDINLIENTVCIHGTMQRIKNIDKSIGSKTKVTIGSPKSDKSTRTVPLTEHTALLCLNMQSNNKNSFILTGTEHYMEPRALQYRFKKYVAECRLDGVHFHTLRHTFATRAVEVGFEIKTLSEILGHSATTVTLERYVHSSMELKRANMNKLNELII